MLYIFILYLKVILCTEKPIGIRYELKLNKLNTFQLFNFGRGVRGGGGIKPSQICKQMSDSCLS